MRPALQSRIVIPSAARPSNAEEARSRGTWGFIPLPPLLALCLLLSAAPAPAAQKQPNQQNKEDPPSCESARADLEKYLDTFPRSCRRSSDCEGYYYRADACLPAIVVRKHKLTGKREQRLLARQQSVGEACTLKWRMKPACSPIPFRAVCRRRACVDALGGAPPAEPASRPRAALPFAAFSFATIRHACGPTDGPALQLTLTKVEHPGKDDARLFLTLYRDLPEPPLTQARSFELAHMKDGDAVRCPRPGACESALRGRVVLEKFDGTGAEGSYELHFKDGSTESGRFKAAWKEVREACG